MHLTNVVKINKILRLSMGILTQPVNLRPLSARQRNGIRMASMVADLPGTSTSPEMLEDTLDCFTDHILVCNS